MMTNPPVPNATPTGIIETIGVTTRVAICRYLVYPLISNFLAWKGNQTFQNTEIV